MKIVKGSIFTVMSLFVLLLTALPALADNVRGDFNSLPGVLPFEKAGLRLDVPPNVFAQNVIIMARELESRELATAEEFFVVKAFDISITNKGGQTLSYLSKPIRVVFNFDDIDYKRASRLNTTMSVGYFRVGYWDQSKNNWVTLPSEVFWNGSKGMVEAETDHGGGQYALLWSYAEGTQLSKVAENNNIRIMVNLTTIRPDVAPYLKNERTMVPLRIIAENLGARVEWTSSEERIDLIRNSDKVKLWIGTTQADKNGKFITLDAVPEVVDGRTFVPLRFVAEAFGAKVSWEDVTQTASVLSN